MQGLIPFALLVGLNTRIYLQVLINCSLTWNINHVLQIKRLNGLPLTGFSQREPGKLKDVRNTQISLAIAGVFLVCHSVRWIPNIWELQQTVTEQVGVLLPLMKVFLYFGILNTHTLNFAIFSCEAQLNTCTCDLSVCLSVVKTEFLIVWSAYDNL